MKLKKLLSFRELLAKFNGDERKHLPNRSRFKPLAINSSDKRSLFFALEPPLQLLTTQRAVRFFLASNLSTFRSTPCHPDLIRVIRFPLLAGRKNVESLLKQKFAIKQI